MTNYHLVVLVHGIWGNSSHMGYLAQQIEQHCKPADPSETLAVYVTGSHAGYLTYDGVDVNGKRISDEILQETQTLSQNGDRVTKFSLIGYSMGGLCARYALGILYHKGFFDSVHPCHFTTFCTPHLGILNPGTSLSSRLFNVIAPLVLAHTGSHMFLKDKKVIGGRTYLPLLQWMADPESKFYRALASFDHRSLYANTINDRRTSWYTTSITNVDPFNSMVNENLSAYAFEYLPGYEPTIIDFSKPIEFNTVSLPESDVFSWKRVAFKTMLWSKLFLYALTFAPLYLLFVVGKATWERLKLIYRMIEFSHEGASSLRALYETVGESLAFQNDSAEDIAEKAHSEEENHLGETLVSDSSRFNYKSEQLKKVQSSEFDERVQDQAELFVDSIFGALNSAKYYDYHSSITSSPSGFDSNENSLLKTRQIVDLKGKSKSSFKVNLTSAQEKIVESMNKLRWNKYPVIIRNTKATHAAVIYRHPDPEFDEGKTIVEHFVKEVLRL